MNIFLEKLLDKRRVLDKVILSRGLMCPTSRVVVEVSPCEFPPVTRGTHGWERYFYLTLW